MLEEADADVLLLFDCCHSAAVPTADCPQRTGGVVEVIAACGYETIAAEVDQHSFTRAITSVLAMASKGLPFSIGELHSRVVSRLKCWTPELATDDKGNFIENGEGRLLFERQPRKTPIYSIISETHPRRSIILGPVSTPSSSSPSSDVCMPDSSETPSPPSTSDNRGENSSKKQKRRADEHGSRHPQVLLAVRLDDLKFDVQKWIEWIRNAPPEAKSIRIEGTYDSFSTLGQTFRISDIMRQGIEAAELVRFLVGKASIREWEIVAGWASKFAALYLPALLLAMILSLNDSRYARWPVLGGLSMPLALIFPVVAAGRFRLRLAFKST
jgi:hypothetical protein